MRAILLVSILACAGLAGCLSDGDDTPGPTDPPTTPAPTAGHPVWVHDANGTLELSAFPGEVPSFEQIHVTTRRSGEPTIGVTRTGAVFYPAIEFDSGVPGASTLPRTVYFRSLDGGQSWEDASPHLFQEQTHQTSFDPYVYTDPTTGRVWAMDMGPHVACNKVSWSDDDGRTWLTREGACPLPLADHPTIFAGPKVGATGMLSPVTDAAGYPNNVYLCSNQIADVQCSLSPDGGLSWLPSQPVFVGVDAQGGLCGSLHGHGHASFVDGTVYLGRGYCGTPMVGISRDGGIEWETVVISDDPVHELAYEHDVSIGTDANGTAYALWNGDNNTRVFLSVSHDQGRTWNTPMDVTAPGVTAVKLPSLVAGAQGRVAFQYIGTETPSGWGIHFEADNDTIASQRRNATWNAYIGVGLDVDTDPVFATTTANDIAQPLKRGDCWDRCFGDFGGMYDFLDIDIDPTTGRIWSALVDVCTGDCDLPGADAETYQRAFGAVAKQTGGILLLTQPIPAR